jgi:hypothetical protein
MFIAACLFFCVVTLILHRMAKHVLIFADERFARQRQFHTTKAVPLSCPMRHDGRHHFRYAKNLARESASEPITATM